MAGKAVEAALKEAGVNLVTMDPVQALWKLQEIGERRPKGSDDEFGDEFDGNWLLSRCRWQNQSMTRLGRPNEYLDCGQSDDTS